MKSVTIGLVYYLNSILISLSFTFVLINIDYYKKVEKYLIDTVGPKDKHKKVLVFAHLLQKVRQNTLANNFNCIDLKRVNDSETFQYMGHNV